MHRRDFVALVPGGLLALVAPLIAEAQPAAQSYRIGILNPTAAPPAAALSAFRNRLADLGYVEGRTIQFESQNAEGRPERLPALAADLVRLKVNVLVTMGTQATKAAKEATSTIPIVFLGVASPVDAGIVASLAQPRGNVTGATDQLGDLGGKVLQLITEVVPKRSRIGVLGDSTNPGSIRYRQTLDRMAQRLSLTLVPIDVRTPEDLDTAFATVSRERVEALMVSPTPALAQRRDRVATLAIQNRLPSIAYSRTMAEAGLLMSYGTIWPDLAQRAAEYVDRILKGANPAELPVVQPTKFELVINLKTAKALGLTMPQSLLLRADEVIQ